MCRMDLSLIIFSSDCTLQWNITSFTLKLLDMTVIAIIELKHN